MPTPYVSGQCGHGPGSWLPPADESSNLARDYAVKLWSRRLDAAEYVHSPARVTASAGDRSELRRCFEKHADEWKTRTAHLSTLSQRIMHPSYQRIIGLGRDALPLIIERLSTHPDHWFWALRSISGEDPVRREDEGRFGAMRDAWIRWGRNRGLV